MPVRYDVKAMRRPSGDHAGMTSAIASKLRREPAAKKIPHPDIDVALHRAIHHYTPAVGRQLGIPWGILVTLAGHAHGLAGPVHPGQLARPAAGRRDRPPRPRPTRRSPRWQGCLRPTPSANGTGSSVNTRPTRSQPARHERSGLHEDHAVLAAETRRPSRTPSTAWDCHRRATPGRCPQPRACPRRRTRTAGRREGSAEPDGTTDGRVEAGHRHRLAAGGRDARQTTDRALELKQDCAVRAPTTAEAVPSSARQHLRRTVGDVEALKLTGRKEPNRPAVGRPERRLPALRARQRSRLGLVEGTQPQP